MSQVVAMPVTGSLPVVSQVIDEQVKAVLQAGEVELARFYGVQRWHPLLELVPFVRLYALMTRRPCVLVLTDRRLLIVYHTRMLGRVISTQAWELPSLARVAYTGYLFDCQLTLTWTNGTVVQVAGPDKKE